MLCAPLSWLCLYGLLCAFDEAKMAQKMVGQALKWGRNPEHVEWETGKLGKWGSTELEAGSKELFLPACLPVVELSATKMDVAIFIKGPRIAKCALEKDAANLCAKEWKYWDADSISARIYG